MGRKAAVGLAVAAAAIGAVVALLVGSVAGFGGSTTTIVETSAASAPSGTIPVPARRPGTAFDPEALYAARAPGVVTIYANLGLDGTAQGSGFVVDRDGVILTNAHVITNAAEARTNVQGARAVYVEFADGERIGGRVVGWDLFSDVGVIRVKPADHPLDPVPLGDSATVIVGEPVAAIGSPFGKQSSLTVGVVSATGRSIDSLAAGGFAVSNAIQIDAPINRGNSGGPLFDADGRVIGINAQIESTSGTNEGVGEMPAVLEHVRFRRAVGELHDDLHHRLAARGIAADRPRPHADAAEEVQARGDAVERHLDALRELVRGVAGARSGHRLVRPEGPTDQGEDQDGVDHPGRAAHGEASGHAGHCGRTRWEDLRDNLGAAWKLSPGRRRPGG